jgi:DNA-directed RNA polymerase subunit E'/Rpb7
VHGGVPGLGANKKTKFSTMIVIIDSKKGKFVHIGFLNGLATEKAITVTTYYQIETKNSTVSWYDIKL